MLTPKFGSPDLSHQANIHCMCQARNLYQVHNLSCRNLHQARYTTSRDTMHNLSYQHQILSCCSQALIVVESTAQQTTLDLVAFLLHFIDLLHILHRRTLHSWTLLPLHRVLRRETCRVRCLQWLLSSL